MQMNARDEQLKRRWEELIDHLSDSFSDAEQLEMEGVLYLIGLQELGKIPNPLSGEISCDLEKAKQAIEMLEMLSQKTKGNLSEELDKTQEMMLSELRLNYVDEANKEA